MWWCPRVCLAALCACTTPAPEATTPLGSRSTEFDPARSATPLPPISVEDGVLGAQQAIAQGQVAPAIDVLRVWTGAHPREITAHLALAHALLLAGDTTGALETLTSIADRAPVAARRAAELTANLGDITAATARLEEAAQRWPEDLGIIGAQVWLATRTGRGNTPETRARIDRLYDAYASGDVESAETLLAVARATLATRTNGGFHDANDVLEQAYGLPDLSLEAGGTWLEEELRLLHAQIFVEKYAAIEVRGLLEPLLARNPNHVEARSLLARAALTTGDLFEATALAKRVLADQRNAPGANLILAWGHVVRGQEPAARVLLSTIVPRSLWQDATLRALQATLAIRGRHRNVGESVEFALTGPDPTGWYFFPQLGELLAHTHLYQELDEALSLALALDPSNFYSRSAYALNLLRLGEDDAGLQQIERAWEGDKFNERTYNTRALFREVIAHEYELIQREGVELRLPIEVSPELSERLFEEIDAARRSFERRYEITIPKMRVEVYRTPREFAVRTIGVPALGALGVCFGPVITLVGPFSGRFNFSRVLWHELAHTYALAASERRVPRWLTEGLSEWEAAQREPSWRANVGEELAKVSSDGRLLTLSQLEGAFILAQDHQAMGRAYLQATAAVEFLMTRLDDSTLRAALAEFRTGRPASEVLPTILRMPMERLDAEYERWISTVIRSKPAGWDPPNDEATTPDPRAALWEAASEALRRGDAAASLGLLDLLDRADGEGYASSLLRGIALRERGDLSGSIQALQAADRYTRARSEHLVLLARIAKISGDLDAERAALRTVLARDFSNVEAPARLIVLALAMGAASPDPIHVERLRQISPTSPRTLAALALASVAKGERRRANHLVDLSLARDPTSADALAILALAARACERPKDALFAATRAVQDAQVSPATRDLLTKIWPSTAR